MDYQLPTPSISTVSSQDLLDNINTHFDRKSSSELGKGEQPTQVEIKEAHFRAFVHERDGVGRNAWYARVQNAELRDVHHCGVWGVKQKQPVIPAAFDWATELEDEERNQGTKTAVSGHSKYEKMGMHGHDESEEHENDTNSKMTVTKHDKEDDCWDKQRNPLKHYNSAENHAVMRRMSR